VGSLCCALEDQRLTVLDVFGRGTVRQAGP
jgi:hypothetical protein